MPSAPVQVTALALWERAGLRVEGKSQEEKVVDVGEVQEEMSMRMRIRGGRTPIVIPMEENQNLKGKVKNKKKNSWNMKRRERKHAIQKTTTTITTTLEGKVETMVVEEQVAQPDVHLVHLQPQQHPQLL